MSSSVFAKAWFLSSSTSPPLEDSQRVWAFFWGDSPDVWAFPLSPSPILGSPPITGLMLAIQIFMKPFSFLFSLVRQCGRTCLKLSKSSKQVRQVKNTKLLRFRPLRDSRPGLGPGTELDLVPVPSTGQDKTWSRSRSRRWDLKDFVPGLGLADGT